MDPKYIAADALAHRHKEPIGIEQSTRLYMIWHDRAVQHALAGHIRMSRACLLQCRSIRKRGISL